MVCRLAISLLPSRILFGTDAGLSASTITRLIETWSAEYAAFEGRDLSEDDFVYVWADGVLSGSVSRRTGCAVWSSSGSDPTAAKELLACVDGYRESTDWLRPKSSETSKAEE